MRLIDADALLKDLKDYRIYDANTYYGFNCAVDAIKEAPTVDAVPVVRCGDCKYFSGSDDKEGEATAIGNCRNESVRKFPCNANFFCAYGERREENNDGKAD